MVDRILLISEHKKNQRLLSALLEQKYRVLLGAADHLPVEPFDLALVDGVGLTQLADKLAALKGAVAPVFLPVLLVSTRQDVGLITRHLWRTVDEIVYQPVQKIELLARIEILLRARRFSVGLRQSKERAEVILNSSSDVVILADNDGVIQQVNARFRDVFGYEPDEIIGRPLHTIAEGERARLLTDGARAVLASRQPQRLELAFRVRPAASFEADAALSPIFDDQDKTQGLVCSLHDISTRKELERQLRQTLEHERELARIRARFISMASHEFRTPLAVIQATSDILRKYEHRLTPEQKEEEFQRISAAIRGMIELLDDVLTISRGEVGSFSFEPETLDLVVFCQSLVEEYQRTLGTGHEMVFEHNGQRTQLVADARHLRHMLGNLLSNAIKYSPSGSAITCSLAFTPQSAIIRVADQGIGIPQEDVARLFQSFYRAGNVGEVPGTGLGLVIARQSAELHGGTIAVDSVEGEGTTFIITLPLSTRPQDRNNTPA
ncbi:ATP-binding protein [Aggregatilinea lenta]|uniref:ATP-binding protein n=1 Tax=Aggregatilinea lenta TaxID=913108 RepID=UPI000E5AF950|nr:ATP-binding protein [Aggregatilinea lenta]